MKGGSPSVNLVMERREDDFIDVFIIPFFQVFLVFGVAGSIKSMPSGYSLDAEFNSTSNEPSRLKFE